MSRKIELPTLNFTLNPRSHCVDYSSLRTLRILQFPNILTFLLLDPSSANYLKKIKRDYCLTEPVNLISLKNFLSQNKNNETYDKIVEGLIEYKNNKSNRSQLPKNVR